MPDWRRYVGERLALPDLETAVVEEVVEDLATQLEDCYQAARIAGSSDSEAEARARAEVPDWISLGQSIQREKGRSDAVRVDRGLENAEAFLRDRGQAWVSVADLLQTLRLAMRRLRRPERPPVRE